MDPRTTPSGRTTHRQGGHREGTRRSGRGLVARHRPPTRVRRPGLYLAAAAAGAVLVNVLLGTGPAAQAETETAGSVSVAQQLGLTAQSAPADVREDLQPLEDLAASRSSRTAEQTAAKKAQADADQAALARQKAAEEAAARAAAEAAAAAETAAAAKAAAQQKAAEEAASAAVGQSSAGQASAALASRVADIANSAGGVRPQAQAAADVVVSNVPGAGSITIGGTRPSAADPNGHPSGLALDYMVMSDAALGDAITQFHIDHWEELGVDYIIWQQRMLSSPNGSWEHMSDRGSATANHMDHPHVNYRG
jgi:hypothetical protein